MRTQATFIIAAALLAPACNTLSAAGDVPAVISEPSSQSRAELFQVVSSALNGVPIILADDALTHSSLLTIERNPPRDLQGRPLTGRKLGRPEQFRLVINGSDCIVVHETDGKRYELSETSCRPE